VSLTDFDITTLRRLEESLWIAETRYDQTYMDEIFARDFLNLGVRGACGHGKN
jgi:hypothetical protein